MAPLARRCNPGTPCVSGDRVFVGTWAGDVHALHLPDGRELWRRNVGSPIHAPLAADDRLVFCPTAAGVLLALDRATGRIVGRRHLGAPALAPPALDRDRLLVSAGRTLLCLDRRSGRTRWSYGFAGLLQARPAVTDDLAAVGAWDNTFRALDLRTGEARWQLHLGPSIYYSPAIASPALWKDLVIIPHIPGEGEHGLLAVHAANGGLAWSAPLPAGYASPALFDDKLLAVSFGGRISCLSAADGRPLWHQDLKEPVDSTPVLLGDAICVITESGRLICLDPDSGQERWHRQVLAPYVFACPASCPERKLLLLSGMDGTLLALDPTVSP